MVNADFDADLISDDGARGTSRRGRGVALVAAGLVAGGALAAGATAFATSSSSPSPSEAAGTSSTTPSGQSRQGAPAGKVGGAAPVRSDEKALDSSAAANVKAAALKAVPGGTVYRVETDAGDGTYEAHMTKADGSLVTVKLDKNFVVTKVESGMGLGDPRPAGGKGGGPGDNDGDGPGGGTAPNGTSPEHA